MSDQHLCLSFWGSWAQSLFVFFEGASPVIAKGDGLKASPETYNALCALQRAIEHATSDVESTIKPRVEGPSPLTPETEVLFQFMAQQFLVALAADEFDVSVEPTDIGHVSPTSTFPTNWIHLGVAEDDGTPATSAVQVLAGPDAGAGTNLLGRIKSALDSSGVTISGAGEP
jgi:hypothetical protein